MDQCQSFCCNILHLPTKNETPYVRIDKPATATKEPFGMVHKSKVPKDWSECNLCLCPITNQSKNHINTMESNATASKANQAVNQHHNLRTRKIEISCKPVISKAHKLKNLIHPNTNSYTFIHPPSFRRPLPFF